MRWLIAVAGGTGTAGLLLVLALAVPAQAVVLTSLDDQSNRSAPVDDPGWNNVGRVGAASGVYLGNRWVLTAGHVSGDGLQLSDGRFFSASIGPDVPIANTGATESFGNADLRMFRLAQDPGLPALSIASAAPGVSAAVTMIGRGTDLKGPIRGWNISGGDPPQWTETSAFDAQVVGYQFGSTARQRWGTNKVSAASSFDAEDDHTWTFATRFDQTTGFPDGNEAQAVPGDSGGGVFSKTGGNWQLSGIMIAQGMLAGQPSHTAVIGDTSIIADVSMYRGQILELLNRPEPLWQNQTNRYDVNRSGRVEPRDFLIVATALQESGVHALSGAPGDLDARLDVNGDYILRVSDALAIATYLTAGLTTEASLASGAHLVPEPSSALLAWSGAACLGTAGLLARRARAQRRWTDKQAQPRAF